MAIVNVEEREAAQVKKILTQITKLIKREFPNHGAIEYFKSKEGIHEITVENGLAWFGVNGSHGFATHMADFVKSSEFANLKEFGEKQGHYMWDAKVYIKDYSWVTFTI